MERVHLSKFHMSRRRWIASALLVLGQSGCGTIFWPERKGQPPGALDPKVVALDAIGLLLFFIPGVIAFAVDFNNGTIYLPPGEHAAIERPRGRWFRVRTAKRRLSAGEIEEVVQRHCGHSIRLRPGAYRATRLDSADALDDLNMDDTELTVACEATEVQFRCQSE